MGARLLSRSFCAMFVEKCTVCKEMLNFNHVLVFLSPKCQFFKYQKQISEWITYFVMFWQKQFFKICSYAPSVVCTTSDWKGTSLTYGRDGKTWVNYKYWKEKFDDLFTRRIPPKPIFACFSNISTLRVILSKKYFQFMWIFWHWDHENQFTWWLSGPLASRHN
jgi:hypothetical protein